MRRKLGCHTDSVTSIYLFLLCFVMLLFSWFSSVCDSTHAVHMIEKLHVSDHFFYSGFRSIQLSEQTCNIHVSVHPVLVTLELV